MWGGVGFSVMAEQNTYLIQNVGGKLSSGYVLSVSNFQLEFCALNGLIFRNQNRALMLLQSLHTYLHWL